jgi:tetratricopeptide (TPR) repeat protein
VAALTRGNYLIFIPVLLAWIALAVTGAASARIRRIALVAAGVSLVILPVTLRNYVVEGDLVLVTSQTGQNFYIGNFRGNATGRYKAPPFVRANPFFEEMDFYREAELRTSGRSMKPSEVSRFWLHEAFAEIRADPSHFVRHTWLKARMLFNQYEVPDNNSYYFFREQVTPVFKLPGPTFGALLPLALCGMFFARRHRSAQLLILLFATYALTIILSFNMSRYRMPMVPVVILFASFGIVHLARLAADSRWREAALAGVFLAVCYPVVYQDLGHDHFAVNYHNLGTQHLRQQLLHRNRAVMAARGGNAAAAKREREAAAAWNALAERQFRLGLAIQPNQPALRKAMGKLLLARFRERRNAHDYAEALAIAVDLNETLPRFADGEAALGRAYSDLGRYTEAREALLRALELSPGHPTAKLELDFVNSLQPAGEPR